MSARTPSTIVPEVVQSLDHGLNSQPQRGFVISAQGFSPGRTHTSWLLWLTLILFIAFTLRLWNLGTQSLWHDEAWSVMSAYQPLRSIDPNYPPFFTVLLGVWIQLAGDSVWIMRFWSLLFGVATVAVIAIVTKRWFGNRAAVLSAMLAAVSPPFWVFSQEIRSYVMVPLLVIVLLALAESVLKWRVSRVSRRIWLWLALTEIILLYVHNLSVPVVAWLNVTVIAALIIQRNWPRIRTWLLIQAGLLILYLPWLITQRPTGTLLNTPPTVGPLLAWDIWQSYFTGIKALVGADDGLMALTAAFGVIALAALIAILVYRRSAQTWLVLSQAILIPIFELIIILVAHIDFHPRYFLAGVPAVLIVIAGGLDTLTRRRFLTPFALTGVVILAVGIMVRMVSVVYSSPIYQHDDFRAIAQRYAQLGPDDAIIIPYGWEPTLDYYSRKMNFKAKLIGIPLHASAETIIERLRTELQGVHQAEVLTWYQLPADVRGAYPCVLGTVGQPTNDSFVVAGLKTDRYASFVVRPFASFDQALPSAIDFGAIRLIDRRGLWGDQGFCAITHWQLSAPTTENWRIALRLRNGLGWDIGKADTELLSSAQVPTSLWSDQQTEIAFSLIKLPVGLPSACYGNYDLIASVYSPQRSQGTQDTLVGTTMNPPDSAAAFSSTGDNQMLQEGLFLHDKELPSGTTLAQGQALRITLDWRETKPPGGNNITVSLQGSGWQVSSANCVPAQATTLTWHELRVPAKASGHAILKVTAPNGNALTLGEYDIAPINRNFTEPPLANRVSASFADAGSLIGVDAPQSINHAEPFAVQLTWKADNTPTAAYTVFVHLLDSTGQVIAQSDAQPAGNTRRTTSWVNGEYIVDQHTLTWNRQDYTGQATLEVGLYDQNTGKRVKLADGSDHATLPSTITVN